MNSIPNQKNSVPQQEDFRAPRAWPWVLAVCVTAILAIGVMFWLKMRPKEEVRPTDKEKIINVKGLKIKMINVEGGDFTMGGTDEQGDDRFNNELPTHRVHVNSFLIGETEVTQELWRTVMDCEPTDRGGWTTEYGRGDHFPAYRVSWNDAQEFIRRLNALTNKEFRLPTEAEWEYAARGGNQSRHYKYSGGDQLDAIAWYWRNSGEQYLGSDREWKWRLMVGNQCRTHSVKTHAANELGIYDMSGNVMEWCSDYYKEYGHHDSYPSSDRVYRGGCWYSTERGCRVSYRKHAAQDSVSCGIGFRLALSVQSSH